MPPLKRSLVWKYCKKISNCLATCKICGKDFRYNGSTSNLMDHLKRKHRHFMTTDEDNVSLESDVGIVNSSTINEDDLDFSPFFPQSSKKSGRKSKFPPYRSFVWKFFDKVENDEDPDTENKYVQCKLCTSKYKFHGNTSNMKGHLKSKHPHTIHNEDSNEFVYEERTREIAGTPSSSKQGDNEMLKEKRVLNYQKLVVPVSMRSVYWKCYGFPASADGEILTKMKIVCLLCRNVITYNRNTSNLRMHLQNKHPNELAQLDLLPPSQRTKDPEYIPKGNARKSSEKANVYSTNLDGSVVINNDSNIINSSNMSVMSLEDYSTSLEVTHTQEDCQDGPQIKLVYSKRDISSDDKSLSEKQVELVPEGMDQHCTFEQSLHPFMIPVVRKSVCDAVAEFIMMDMQLPDIVEGRGFQRLIATLKSPCEIPSKAKLTDEVIPRVYESHREVLLETIQGIKSDLALTVEEWDSAGEEIYITFSVSYQLEKDDNVYNKVLSTVHCPATVDSSYWNLVFENLLEDWGIKLEKIRAVVCGSCRQELIDAISRNGLIVFPCLVNTLQEVCTRVCFEQEDMREILAKCRAFIYLIYKNSSALAALRIQDDLLSLDETPLTSDYPRVWISTYAMLESVNARRQIIPSILENIEFNTYDKEMVNFNDQEWGLIEDVLNVLEPFKVTMMTLSEEKSPLVSLLKPLLWQLVSCHLKIKEEDNHNVQVFKEALKSLLADKYTDPAVSDLLRNATCLDPRFKGLPNMVEESKIALEGPIKEALTKIIEENPQQSKPAMEETPEETPEKKKPKLLGMVMLLGDMCPQPSEMPNEDRASLEIVQYQSEPTAPLDQCPMAWWTRVSAKCPFLARLFIQYTCVPATAIPSTRIPLESHVSYHIKRSNLSPEVVDRLVFLNANYTT